MHEANFAQALASHIVILFLLPHYLILEDDTFVTLSFECLSKRFFTALHVMQTRSSDNNSVRPSVCLTNTWIVTKRDKDLSRFLHHTIDHLA